MEIKRLRTLTTEIFKAMNNIKPLHISPNKGGFFEDIFALVEVKVTPPLVAKVTACPFIFQEELN